MAAAAALAPVVQPRRSAGGLEGLEGLEELPLSRLFSKDVAGEAVAALPKEVARCGVGFLCMAGWGRHVYR